MTVASCADTAAIYVTELISEVPLGNEATWVTCTTTANAIHYSLSNNTVGLRPFVYLGKRCRWIDLAHSENDSLKYVPKLVLGQEDETKNPHMTIAYNGTGDAEIIGSKYYFSSGNRIFVYNQEPATWLPTPDAILGQKVGFYIASNLPTANQTGDY